MRPLAPRLLGSWAIGIAFGATLVACDALVPPSPAPIIYAPSTFGVVRDKGLDNGVRWYEFVDGRSFRAPNDQLYLLGGGEPQVDELLVGGSEPGQWIYGVHALAPNPNGGPADCYAAIGPTRIDQTHVYKTVHDAARGDVVIVFGKGPQWIDPEFVPGTIELIGVFTCINAAGQATEHRTGQ